MPVEKIRTFLGSYLERGVTKVTKGVIYRCTDCGESWDKEQAHKCLTTSMRVVRDAGSCSVNNG